MRPSRTRTSTSCSSRPSTAFGDFDLWCEIEVQDGAELEIAVRLVEPVLREGGIEPCHARFSVLRLSTAADGPAFRTREQALFQDDPRSSARGGVRIAGGLPATVTLGARGRSVEANVAGQKLGPFATTDAHGQLAFVARGGMAALRSLEIRPVPRPLRLLPIGWGAILGAGLGALIAGLASRSRARAVFALSVVPLAAWGVSAVVTVHLLPECEPETVSLVLAAFAGAPRALALARRTRAIAVIVGIVAFAAVIETVARSEAVRLRPLEDPRLTAWFGDDSGIAPYDALARRMTARDAAHTTKPDGERVVFLGGGSLWESDPDYAKGIAPLACGRASRALAGKKLDGATMPTLASHLRQQLACWERWYERAFAARAIVLAIPAWESEPLVDLDARTALLGRAAPASAWSRAVELRTRTRAERVVGSSPEELGTALAAFVERCRARDTKLLLVVDPALAPPWRDAALEVSQRLTVPSLGLDPVADPMRAAEAIGDALADLLR
ncbi:MAG: hypothetical protein HZB39_07810 [Planctomycetes bacterium]|nr:hypothetical protein [Planctomycetota bacterium]